MEKSYVIEYGVYSGNSEVTWFDGEKESGSSIMNDYNLEGFCDCLETFGYNKKEAPVVSEELQEGKTYKVVDGKLWVTD